jgi:diguanylate cyclase (GGDEF)-like protein
MLAVVCNKNRDLLLHRMDTIDTFCRQLPASASDDAIRAEASADAHKLAGSLGMFGLAEGTELAREIEYLLKDNSPRELLSANIPSLVARLRALIEFFQVTVDAPPADHRPRMLIVVNDLDVAEGISINAKRRGIQARIAKDIESARVALRETRFDIVVFDLTTAKLSGHSVENDYAEEVRNFVLSRSPMQVLALTSVDTFEDRVTAAQVGAHGFLPINVPPNEIVDTCEHLLDLQSTHFKVLIVDDDHAVISSVKGMLEQHSIRVTGLSDPRLFWNVLEESTPDLVILDLEMPNFSGLELCRAIRNDSQWNRLPLVFLSVNSDAKTVTSIFSAGADDFVSKPIIELELTTRVRNRLDRDRLYRNLSDYDQLTNVRNRRSSNVVIANYLRLAERHGLPVSFAIVDLDKFKRLNDTYGHQAGDECLRAVAELLRQSFRSEDVVARWGGEEFVVAMYSMRRADAVERMAEVLERLEAHEFKANSGARFRVSFSGGVAEFPVEGKELHTLYRLADEALYRAKAAGGSKIYLSSTSAGEVRTNVAIVSQNVALSAPLRHRLEMRGYTVDLYQNLGEAKRELASKDVAHGPDVILIDEALGDGVAEIIQALHSVIPVKQQKIFLLAAPDSKSPVDGLERIEQPLKKSALIQQLRFAISR